MLYQGLHCRLCNNVAAQQLESSARVHSRKNEYSCVTVRRGRAFSAALQMVLATRLKSALHEAVADIAIRRHTGVLPSVDRWGALLRSCELSSFRTQPCHL
jgi:hypothetical protein